MYTTKASEIMQKIHVLALNTSPKSKGNTSALLQEAIKGCESVGATTENISIKGKKLTPCQGCSVCQSGKSCPLQDDVPEILQKMQTADVILLASPTFFYNVTAQCKIIMDRSYAVQPLNGNKVSGIFITAGSMGTSAAVNSCNMFFTVHGITSAGYVSSLGKTQDNSKAMQSAYDLGVKTIMMAQALKDAPQVFGMHSHYAYGTHTK